MKTFDDAPAILWAAVRIPETPDPSDLLEPERTYGLTLRGERRRREWYAGRRAARAVLNALGGPEVTLLPDDEGAPVPAGPNAEGLEVSLTHGASWALCAGHRRPRGEPHLGIDLVDDADGRRAARVLGRHLTERERALLEADPDAAALLWGAREAVAKATRTGMFAFALLDVAVETLDRARSTLTVGYPGCDLVFGRWVSGATLIRARVTEAATAAAQSAAHRRKRGTGTNLNP
ncbi:MAG TPA: 4'-phosphopantetheinyl transferase superfamily protein [Polyangiaceae bacterium LLY-WYZ-14_1]|nr:4'-phosphopantetheinyl transferase superfamily protein [Polyangiaceae bacterium LLY-WYZ-14_1]